MSLTMIYIIGVVAVIALLVLVLVLRSVRAGKRQALAASEPAFSDAAPGWTSGPDTWPVDDELPATDGRPPSADAEPPSADDEPPAIDAEPVDYVKPAGHTELAGYTGSIGYTGPADDAEPTVEAGSEIEAPSAKPPAIAMFMTDPVLVLVTSLLQDAGELNPAEFRRLELYRPQRIVDAVDALTPTMTGRANESKRSRLQRIRQYAVSLVAAFDSKERSVLPERVVTPGATTVEPAPISPLSPLEATQLAPPEDWGAPIGGSELTLDSELSLLPDALSPAAEVEGTPPEAEDAAPEAEDVPAPAPEQSADDVAAMAPQEISDAPALSEDIDSKKAAIDALERLGTPEALSQLQHSLEDPDTDVQLYALSAAERLLGPS